MINGKTVLMNIPKNAYHPILFSGPMVRAILAGTKTQTRRVFKTKIRPDWVRINPDGTYTAGDDITKAYEIGKIPHARGAMLWVRESWRTFASLDDVRPRNIASGAAIEYAADRRNLHNIEKLYGMGKTRPGIFMPRWACRIVLRVVDVDCQRLQSMDCVDAWAEGTPDLRTIENGYNMRDCFRVLWDSINGPGSWVANPWVWVYKFERILD